MDGWEESSVKINHMGMKQRLTEGDTYDDISAAAERPPPPWIDKDSDTEEWEKSRQNAIKEMRAQKTYQFVMLLSGFTNEKMSKYWSRKENASGKKMAQCNINADDNYDCGSTTDAKKYHDWYINTSWADGMIYLTPMVYGHMEEALTALTQRFDHLRNAKLEHFIESPRVRTLFARLVAMCIRISDVLSGKKYHLDSTYRRIHMERQRLMNVFKHIKLIEQAQSWDDIHNEKEPEARLIFEKGETNPRYASVDTRWDVADSLKLKNELLQLNKRKKYLN